MISMSIGMTPAFMGSFYQNAPYELATETYKFLRIKDFSTLRTANRYWRSHVNWILDEDVKNMARGLGISDHKSDLELEREIRVFVMCVIYLLKRDCIFHATSINIYEVFNMIQMHATSVNFPKLTLKILQRKRKRLVPTEDQGIVAKLIANPALHKESLKYLGRKVYKLKRMPLIDSFHNELDISYRKLFPLFRYSVINLLKSNYVSAMKYHLKFFAGFMLYMETIRAADIKPTPFVSMFNLLLFCSVFLWTLLKYIRTADERFESFLDD